MATKDQFEFFKRRFDDVDTHMGVLTKRAEIYLSIISLIFTGLIFKMNDFKAIVLSNGWMLYTMLALVISLIASAISVMLSLMIRNYTPEFDEESYLNELGEKETEDKDFYDNRISFYLASTKSNTAKNNTKALQLKIAGYFLLSVFVFIGAFIIQLILP